MTTRTHLQPPLRRSMISQPSCKIPDLSRHRGKSIRSLKVKELRKDQTSPHDSGQTGVQTTMKSFIRSLSPLTEFCLVIFICFGLSIAASLIWIGNHLNHAPRLHTQGMAHPNIKDVIQLENGDIVFSVILQLITLGITLCIGRIRGWSLATFGLRVSWKWTGLGVVLFFALQLVIHLLQFLMSGSFFDAANPHDAPAFLRVNHLTVPFVILIAIVNPVFEEAIETGYFFHALRRFGPWITVSAAALFRGFLHVTMGLNGFVTMFAMGLLYGFVYWRWRQLWPLIVAHSLQMFYALLPQALAT
jgi:membrane protease YdiL (CAAX protease family)